MKAGAAAIFLFAAVAGSDLSVADEMTFHLLVEGAVIGGGAPTLRVTEGDDVTIVLESDDSMEIHLHGYDLAVSLAPGDVVSLVFRADIVGRFPAEAHDHDAGHRPALFYLEVHPH